MERERIYVYFFLSLMVFFLFASLFILFPFVTPILWAVVLGMVIYPAHERLEKVIKNENLSALIMTCVVFLFLVIPFSVASVVLVQQLIDLSQRIILQLNEHSYRDILRAIRELPFVRDNSAGLSYMTEFLQREEFRNILAESLNKGLQFLGDKLGKFAFVFTKSFFYTFVFLITFFFVLRDGPEMFRRIERLIPMKEEDVKDLLGTIYRTVLAVVYGTVGTALIQSLLALIAYSVIGLKFALLWSVATFFSAFVPPFGASAIWFPIAVYSFLELGVWQGVFMMVWGLFLISSMDNLVRPLIIKKGVKIPYVVLFFSTIGGLLKFGFIGVFLGPIIFTTLFSLFKIYEKRILMKET